MGDLTVLDLFSGAGGFSLGAKHAGMNVVGSIELDRFASDSYEANFPSTPHFRKSVTDCSERWLKSSFSGVDTIIGGPPCQGFSVAGPSQYGRTDDRNSLILQMARIVRALRPRYVVLENVRGILAGKLSQGGSALGVYLEALDHAGYSSKIFDLNAADFGTPQLRRRIFVVSGYSDTKLPSSVPRTHGTRGRPWVSSLEALDDLPALAAGEGVDGLVAYEARPANAYQRKMRLGSEGIRNHLAMKHTPRIVARLHSIPVGGSMRHVGAEHGQRSRTSGAIDAGQRYKMNCTRVDPNRPAIALPANFQTIHVHPWEHRMLTAREGARIQGFPDWFAFHGPRTLMSKKLLMREGRKDEIGLSQYNQIGNAVPPLLAAALLREL